MLNRASRPYFPIPPTPSPKPDTTRRPSAPPKPTSPRPFGHLDSDDHTITLSEFDPRQELRILVYDNGYYDATFVTEWYVTTDAAGFLILEVTGGTAPDFQYHVFDRATARFLMGTRQVEGELLRP